MKLAFQIFLLVFNLLNITFHGVGIYAIASLYKRSKHKPQRLYILSLSASEVFINFLEIFRNLPGKWTLRGQIIIAVRVENKIEIILIWGGQYNCGWNILRKYIWNGAKNENQGIAPFLGPPSVLLHRW